MKTLEFILWLLWEFVQMLYLIVIALLITMPLYILLSVIFIMVDMVRVPENAKPEKPNEYEFKNAYII